MDVNCAKLSCSSGANFKLAAAYPELIMLQHIGTVGIVLLRPAGEAQQASKAAAQDLTSQTRVCTKAEMPPGMKA